MTLTAREALQALLDGKTLHRKNATTITPTEWGFQMQADDNVYFKTNVVLEDCTIIEEYPLDFKQALKAMLDGKVVMCEVFHDREYFFIDGWFRFQYHDANWLQIDWFTEELRDAKWKMIDRWEVEE